MDDTDHTDDEMSLGSSASSSSYETAASFTIEELIDPTIYPLECDGTFPVLHKLTVEIHKEAPSEDVLGDVVTNCLPNLDTLNIRTCYDHWDPSEHGRATADELGRQREFMRRFEVTVPFEFEKVTMDYPSVSLHLGWAIDFATARNTKLLQLDISDDDLPDDIGFGRFCSWFTDATCQLKDIRFRYSDAESCDYWVYHLNTMENPSPRLEHVQIEQLELEIIGKLPDLNAIKSSIAFQNAKKYSFRGINFDKPSLNAFVRFLDPFVWANTAVRLSKLWFEREYGDQEYIDAGDMIKDTLAVSGFCRVLSLTGNYAVGKGVFEKKDKCHTELLLLPWFDPDCNVKWNRPVQEFFQVMSVWRPFMKMINREVLRESENKQMQWRVNQEIRTLRFAFWKEIAVPGGHIRDQTD